jgi:hypothetical protein
VPRVGGHAARLGLGNPGQVVAPHLDSSATINCARLFSRMTAAGTWACFEINLSSIEAKDILLHP